MQGIYRGGVYQIGTALPHRLHQDRQHEQRVLQRGGVEGVRMAKGRRRRQPRQCVDPICGSEGSLIRNHLQHLRESDSNHLCRGQRGYRLNIFLLRTLRQTAALCWVELGIGSLYPRASPFL